MNGQYALPANVLGPQHEIISQHVSISSNDRIDGYPGQFVVDLKPRGMDHIMGVELLSFVAQLHPYNILQNAVYHVIQAPASGTGVTTTYQFTITAGDYTLHQLLTILNFQPLVRFSYNDVTGKVIIERLSGVTGILRMQEVLAAGSTAYIGPLIGFPNGGVIDAVSNAIQSTLAVSPSVGPTSLIIGFDEIPPGVVTTGNISSGFTIPVNNLSYNKQTRQIHFSKENGFAQMITMNRKTISRLYIKIQNQSLPGTAFRFVGGCNIDLNILYLGGSSGSNN